MGELPEQQFSNKRSIHFCSSLQPPWLETLGPHLDAVVGIISALWHDNGCSQSMKQMWTNFKRPDNAMLVHKGSTSWIKHNFIPCLTKTPICCHDNNKITMILLWKFSVCTKPTGTHYAQSHFLNITPWVLYWFSLWIDLWITTHVVKVHKCNLKTIQK